MTGADGVMLGRAIFGNPWLLNIDKTVNEIRKMQALAQVEVVYKETTSQGVNIFYVSGGNSRLRSSTVAVSIGKDVILNLDGVFSTKKKIEDKIKLFLMKIHRLKAILI
jgi:tRNA-dihydrouridine synthase